MNKDFIEKKMAVFALGGMIIDALGGDVEINTGDIKRLYLDTRTDAYMVETADGGKVSLDDMCLHPTAKTNQILDWLLTWRDNNPEKSRKVDAYMDSFR